MKIENFYLIRNILVIYLVVLGFFLIIQSIVEFIIPERMYKIQKKWIFHKLFPLHGIVLMIGGMPLTFFRDSVPGKIMMIIGIITVFTGPLFLLYPSKARAFFLEAELETVEIKNKLVHIDAVVRLCIGIFVLYVMLYYEKALTVVESYIR